MCIVAQPEVDREDELRFELIRASARKVRSRRTLAEKRYGTS